LTHKIKQLNEGVINIVEINEELLNYILKIKEKRKKDGYIVEHESINKYSLEEAMTRIIKSHM